MPEVHSKSHQNWWFGFIDIALHDTEAHSFIIIRIHILMFEMRKAQHNAMEISLCMK